MRHYPVGRVPDTPSPTVWSTKKKPSSTTTKYIYTEGLAQTHAGSMVVA